MSLETSPSIAAISAALLAFQGAVEGVKRNSDNPFFKSKYADLETVVGAARPHLQAVGVVFLQSPGSIKDGYLSMTTRLIHAESGEWIEGTGEIPLAKKDPQGAGSAITFVQRYHLMAMLGLPPTDDDGEGAIDRENKRPAQQSASKAPEKPQKGKSLYNERNDAITNATTPDELKTAWAAAWTDWKSGALEKGEIDFIQGRYESRKEKLTPKPDALQETLGTQK